MAVVILCEVTIEIKQCINKHLLQVASSLWIKTERQADEIQEDVGAACILDFIILYQTFTLEEWNFKYTEKYIE